MLHVAITKGASFAPPRFYPQGLARVSRRKESNNNLYPQGLTQVSREPTRQAQHDLHVFFLPQGRHRTHSTVSWGGGGGGVGRSGRAWRRWCARRGAWRAAMRLWLRAPEAGRRFLGGAEGKQLEGSTCCFFVCCCFLFGGGRGDLFFGGCFLRRTKWKPVFGGKAQGLFL